MESEFEFDFEPEYESDSDDDQENDCTGSWMPDDPTDCLPYEKLDIENWTNAEHIQLAYDGIAVYNASHNTNYQLGYISKSVILSDEPRYFISCVAKDYKTMREKCWTYTFVGNEPCGGGSGGGKIAELMDSGDSISDKKDFSSSSATSTPLKKK